MSSLAPSRIETTVIEAHERPAYYGRSFGDPVSRLFWKGHELWMGVLPPYAADFAALLAEHRLDELFADRFLCPLYPERTATDTFGVTYRLEEVPRITYWHEWSPKMLRAACLRLIELMERLVKQGLTLRNPQPWNLLFFGQTFSYINAGTIVPFDEEAFRRACEKLLRFFIRPLLMIEGGYTHVARCLSGDMREGVLAADFPLPSGESTIATIPSGAREISSFLDNIQAQVRMLRLDLEGNRWSDYAETHYDFRENTSWGRKQTILTKMLEKAEIESVLDLGANNGHYARLAAQHGRVAIGADFDPVLIDSIFAEIEGTGVPIYPVVLDFSHPAPGQGVDGKWFPPATERLKADLVLCFALSHHLVFGKYRLDFNEVALGIRSFTKSWALVEYVGLESVRPAEWRPDAVAWYSADVFATILRRYFPVVEVLPASEDGRRLIVCGPDRSLL